METLELKVVLTLSSPFIVRPETPVDGMLSFACAVIRGFDLKNQKGAFKISPGGMELPVSKWGYVNELPIERVEYGNAWFYAVSSLFGTVTRKRRFILRRFPDYMKAYRIIPSMRRKGAMKSASTYSSKLGSGKLRAMRVPVDTYEGRQVWFYAAVPVDRAEEFVEMVEVLKYVGIGKKTGHGYGQVSDVEVIPLGDCEEDYDGLFVKTEEGKIPARPIPVEFSRDVNLPKGYYPVELYTSIVPPYYLPVLNERCFFCYPAPLKVL